MGFEPCPADPSRKAAADHNEPAADVSAEKPSSMSPKPAAEVDAADAAPAPGAAPGSESARARLMGNGAPPSSGAWRAGVQAHMAKGQGSQGRLASHRFRPPTMRSLAQLGSAARGLLDRGLLSRRGQPGGGQGGGGPRSEGGASAGRDREWPLLRATYMTPRLAIAWAANGSAFVLGYICLSYLVLTASPVDDAESREWAAGVAQTYLFSLLQTWLLLDLIKCTVATAISSEMALMVLAAAEAKRAKADEAASKAARQAAARRAELSLGEGTRRGKLDRGEKTGEREMISTHLGAEAAAAPPPDGADGGAEDGAARGERPTGAGLGVLRIAARAALGVVSTFAM